jgi:hypothetical protein
MDSSEADESGSAETVDNETARYEAPRILWRETYETTAFGVSCLKIMGSCSTPNNV